MAQACRSCGLLTDATDGLCVLCAERGGGGPSARPVPGARATGSSGPGTGGRVLRLPIGWVYLGVGFLLALAFTLARPLAFMGWLLGSLFHETGHVAFAWYVGCPAYPAISLRGHAGAFHKPQSAAVLFLIGVMLVLGVVLAKRSGRFLGLAVGLLVAWPLFAFVEPVREVGFLLSGHLGELVFAGIFLYRARTGEAIERLAERPLYACLGWFLVGRNVVLSFGLSFSEAARYAYAHNGSFGMENDYIRAARDWLHVPLAAVGAFMLLVSLAVFPVVLAVTWSPRES